MEQAILGPVNYAHATATELRDNAIPAADDFVRDYARGAARMHDVQDYPLLRHTLHLKLGISASAFFGA